MMSSTSNSNRPLRSYVDEPSKPTLVRCPFMLTVVASRSWLPLQSAWAPASSVMVAVRADGGPATSTVRPFVVPPSEVIVPRYRPGSCACGSGTVTVAVASSRLRTP
jgi:hypothetical protein